MFFSKKELQQHLDGNIIEYEPLSRHTTFRIGGSARFFYIANTVEQLVEAVKICRELSVPYYLLGGGSNVLATDDGFDGMIIKLQYKPDLLREKDEIYSIKELNNEVVLRADAMVSTAFLVRMAIEHGYIGLEFLYSVPGTIGGATVANAHTFFLGDYYKEPQTICQRIKEIEIFTRDNRIRKVSPEYYFWTMTGSNIFEKGDVVLRVYFNLKRGSKREIDMAKKFFCDYKKFRALKPYIKYPSAGSVFRNHQIEADTPLDRIDPMFIKKGIIPAGWLIEQAGLKGKKIGGAQISEEHGNFIINVSNAKSEDVVKLIKMCKDRVMELFGIELHEEIKIIK